MQDCKLGDTHVAKEDKFSLNQYPKGNIEVQEMKKILYAYVLGNLMYAQVYTQPNITYIVGILCKCLSNPGMDH